MSLLTYTVLLGDARERCASVVLGGGILTAPSAKGAERLVRCCVTSPPYFGLRDYNVQGQLGAEATPEEYVANLVSVFREVRRLLADDGTLWLNLGDSYAGSWGAQGRQGKTGQLAGRSAAAVRQVAAAQKRRSGTGSLKRTPGLKPKDLIGIPWRVAFALQADGWFLRSDIIWCLSGGAWVYARTQKGDMPIMTKDLVRLRPETVQLWNGTKWTQVLGWGRSNDTSHRVELTLRSGERIGCTGGHLWPTQRGNVAARDLQAGDVISTCSLPQPEAAARPGFITDDLLWLLGLYMAEGSRNGSAIQLSLNSDEIAWLPRLQRAAGHLGGTMTHTLSGNNLAVRMYGAVLRSFIETYIGGQTALNKHFRACLWSLPNEALHIVADGYLNGDGHHDVKNCRWRIGFARNYSLERDLRTLSARLGATLTLSPQTARYQGGKRPCFRGEWRWTRSGHHNEADRGEVVRIGPSRARHFWDIAVADEPHLFALASGVLTHNCKPNPTPESVLDRPTKAHEYVFLFSKSKRYFYDANALREPHRMKPQRRLQARRPVEHSGGVAPAQTFSTTAARETKGVDGHPLGRNARSVWSVATIPSGIPHFAMMPPELARRCIQAGSAPGDTILDPFSGTGTTGCVALASGRSYLGVELNPAWRDVSLGRLARVSPLLAREAPGSPP